MRQSFAWWSFTHGRDVEPGAFLRAAAAAGARGVEMLPEPLWPLARDQGFALVTVSGHALEHGFNDPARHAALKDEVCRKIDTAAAGKVDAVIVFAGSRFGDGADGPAIGACVDGLGPVVAHASRTGVRLLLELLNSKVDHPGHQCDRTAFGANVVRRVNSPALRLLYDGYHMQLMEGDLSRTINAHIDLIGHIHTGGAPGRRDLDDRQEVNWRAIASLLRRLGYDRWVGHEFVPRGEPIAALRQAIDLFAEIGRGTVMQFDAIVVGSGISGGWAAKELCERGLKVLLLERGPHIEHGADYSHDIAARLRRRDDQVPLEERQVHYPYYEGVEYALFNSNRKFWASDHDYPYETVPGKPYRWIRGYHLGGRSLTWWRQSYRLAPDDFESNLKDGHGVDWPIRYDDLAPWYDHVEAFAGVCGDYDEIPHLPDGDFLPPYAFNCVEEVAKERIEAEFPTRRFIIGRAAQLSRVTKVQMDLGRKRCEQRMRCVHGCPLGAYFSSLSATLPAAQNTGNLTIVTDAIVEKVEYDPKARRASGVRVVDRLTKARRSYEARLVFLNASAINTAAILLNSVSDAFPRGLANFSDQVGRNLMDHVSCDAVIGRYPGFDDVPDAADRPTGIYIPRYAHTTERDKPYLRGFGMQGGAGRTRRIEARVLGGAEREDDQPGRKPWSFSLRPFGEVLPNPNNRVTLSPSRIDGWGIPVPIIDAAHGRNEYTMMREAARDAAEMLKAAGCVDITPWEEAGEKLSPPGDRIHEMGTARMGRDPATSVLNGWGQAHDVPNVFVSDGAAMASSASMNPSLTYMALAARAAIRAADLLKEGAL